jgi:hypothetical protein
MARRPPVVTGDGSNTIHWPGVYDHVLRQVCIQDGSDPYAALTDRDWAEVARENAVNVAALMAQRAGQPVETSTLDLPDGMPPPFKPFPDREITVRPDDTVTLRPSGAPPWR